VPSDNQRNSSLSALRLSEIALEPVATSHSVTVSSADSVEEPSAMAIESKLSRLSRESDLSTSTDAKRRKMEDVQLEQESAAADVPTAAETEAGPGDSQPDVTTSRARSRPAGIIYQSSLPDLVDSREDSDYATAAVSILPFSAFSVVIVVVPQSAWWQSSAHVHLL